MSEQEQSNSGPPAATGQEILSRGTELEPSTNLPLRLDNPVDAIANLLIEESKEDGEDTREDTREDSDDVPTIRTDDKSQGSGAEGEEGEGEGEEGEADTTGTAEGSLETLSDAAKRLELDDKSAYDLVVPMGEGVEPMSIGALKDAYRDKSEWAGEFAERERTLTNREIEAAQVQQDLAYFQEEIIKNVPPQRIEEVQRKAQGQLAVEATLLTKAIPEFADAQVFNAWRDDAKKYASQFGFKPHELVINDHRLIRFMAHAMKQDKFIERLALNKPERKGPPKRRRKLQPHERKSNRARTETENLDAIAKLIEGSL